MLQQHVTVEAAGGGAGFNHFIYSCLYAIKDKHLKCDKQLQVDSDFHFKSLKSTGIYYKKVHLPLSTVLRNLSIYTPLKNFHVNQLYTCALLQFRGNYYTFYGTTVLSEETK